MFLSDIVDEAKKVDKLLDLAAFISRIKSSKEIPNGEFKSLFIASGKLHEFNSLISLAHGMTKSKHINSIINSLSMEFESYIYEFDNIVLSDDDERSSPNRIDGLVNRICENAYRLLFIKYDLENISEELLEEIPPDFKDSDNLDTTVFQSYTKFNDLIDMSKDLADLNSIFTTYYTLIDKKENKYFIRKVASGSLEVIITTTSVLTSLVTLIFLFIHNIQQTKTNSLSNDEKKLTIVNNLADSAMKMLELDPNNPMAKEIYQKTGYHILCYLERNPIGKINDQYYNLGEDIKKIEENNSIKDNVENEDENNINNE